MEKLIRYLGALDWLVAGSTLAVGLYLQNYWVIGAGAIGLVTAYLQPAKRFQEYLGKKLIRKGPKKGDTTAQVLQDDAFYAAALVKTEPVTQAMPALPPRTYASPASGYRATFLSANRHNMLKVSHLNLYNETSGATYH